ncbi:hypothetical protein JXM67_00225 [candidate division WOR-3 bacterium]|nr:hypothetical protein [candidate division WOR-3 bacterium]
MEPSVLLINCCRLPDDERIEEYVKWLEPHFEVVVIRVDDLTTSQVGQDAVVVSDSEQLLSDKPQYESMEITPVLKSLYLETTKPLLGIGYGHCALAATWGAEIIPKRYIHRKAIESERMEAIEGFYYTVGPLVAPAPMLVPKASYLEGLNDITLLQNDEFLEGLGTYFAAFECYKEQVRRNHALKRNFIILAESSTCKVEAIRHKKSPLWAIQFHPERSGASGHQIAANFAKIVTQNSQEEGIQ